MTTVFFGPFIGEFAWELLYWQGWVRKLCLGPFRSAHKIAASRPGRQLFYPYIDEFWPLPDWFLALDISAHDYFADGWRGGFPGQRMQGHTWRSVLGSLRRFQPPVPMAYERPLPIADIEPQAEVLLEEFRQRLAKDAICFVPWKANRYEADDLEFGVTPGAGARRFVTKPIPFIQQSFDVLQSTAAGERWLQEHLTETRPLVALFPRSRLVRRADKNWPRERYMALIEWLRQTWPEYRIAVCGEPGGTHFADGVPTGCLDLIQVPAHLRMDIQLAALKRSVMAIGGMSGAMFVAMAAGCPTLFWGLASSHARFHRENVLGTPMLYHAELLPPVSTVTALAEVFRAQLERAGRWPTPSVAELHAAASR